MKKLSLLIAIMWSTICVSQFSVVETNPVSQSMNSTVNQDIEISFSGELSPFSLGSYAIQVFGRWSGPMMTSYDFNEEFNIITLIPEGEFIAGEMVTVNLSKDIFSVNSDSLSNGYAFSFWVKSEPAGLEMEMIQEIEMKLPGETFIQCYGAYAGDLNDDGFSDLAVVNEDANDVRVLLNNGSGTYNDFTIYEMPSGFKPSPNEGADFNHDGYIDLAVSHVQSDIVSVLMGDGNGGFLPEVGYTVGQGVRGIATIDLEADGHADIVTANRDQSTISLLRNNGDGLFEDISSIPGISDEETAIAVADANEDGIMDLFVGAFSGSEVFILLNDGEGNFSSGGTADISGRSWMITIGDVNNDGHVDLVSANSNGHNCSVHFGDGEGGFSETFSYDTGNFPLAIDLGDLDGDGDLDMITSNYSGINYTFFENDGTGLFINPISYPAAAAGSCALFHDRDNNGTLDLTLIDELEDLVFLYDHISTGVEEINFVDPIIGPNPFDEYVKIELNGNYENALEIFDITGKKITAIAPENNNTKTVYHWYPSENLPSGTYLLNIENINLSSRKLIKR